MTTRDGSNQDKNVVAPLLHPSCSPCPQALPAGIAGARPPSSLAHIVAQANIQRLSLIGLSKNVGKTTTTNHLLETLLSEGLYRAEELVITSLGLDGEATDALTGLPKPRYVPQSGIIVATTADLLRQAESEGTQLEHLLQLPGRTALGLVMLARVVRPGRIIIAGPTLLRDLRSTLDQLTEEYGTRLAIIEGAINRLGAASPAITDACIVCTGASAGATPEIVARRTADVLARLTTPQTRWIDAYRKLEPQARLLICSSENGDTEQFMSLSEPAIEAQWIIEHMQPAQRAIFLLRGAFTEELSRELLAQLPQQSGNVQSEQQAELVIGDATRIFCHSVVLQRLAARGLHVRVAAPIHILALTINPYTPEYACTPQRLLDALIKELPSGHPPILDVVSGLSA